MSPSSTDSITIEPVSEPVIGVAEVPGSKSITNRALVLAALADGTTTLTNALFADDTERMMDCLRALGFTVEPNVDSQTITVQGLGGTVPASKAELFVGNSGTTARFITPLAALGHGNFVLDGVARMRQRPMGDLLHALTQLGVDIESTAGNGCPPIRLGANGLHGGSCTVRADKSSQFLSGLLISAPFADGSRSADTAISVEGEILSAPYIAMTTQMISAFGGMVQTTEDGRFFTVPGKQHYRAIAAYPIEPDASAASYFLAAAAITGGRVRVKDVGKIPLQGDWAFADVLSGMGCAIKRGNDFIEVSGRAMHGIHRDMNAISDTVMTLAVVAIFADSPTTIENVAHIREKETDRLAAVATELMRLGVRVEERADGLTIYPCDPSDIRQTTIQTYDDHRMAMAFALVGLRVPGITIANPTCVAKTFPDYFDRLKNLVAGKNPTVAE